MGGGWLAWISVGETVAEFRKRSMDARKLRLSRNWGMLSNKFGFTAPGSLDTHLCYAATIPPLRHTVRFRFLDKADDGLRRGTGTERDRSESPPAAARPIASAAAPAAPAPRPAGGGVPAPAARRAPSASAPRPDTPAGCRNIAPSPRRSSRQLPDVTLRRVEHLRHWLAVTIL